MITSSRDGLLHQFIDKMKDPNYRQQSFYPLAEDVAQDFTPIVGEAKSAYEADQAFKNMGRTFRGGDYFSSAGYLGEGLTGLLGAVPVLGLGVRGIKKGVDLLTDFPKTGNPFKFNYNHNTEKAGYYGSRFGQDIEPAGKYVMQNDRKIDDPRIESGTVTLKNPLVIESEGLYGESGNWKNKLSAMYEGKTGEALSDAVRADGYDGIVSTETFQDKPYTSEIVLLKNTRKKPENALTVTHNISEGKLDKVDELGGLPSPSLAVMPSEMQHTDQFGEISLLGTKKLGDPEQVPVYSSDIWSPRVPDPEYRKPSYKSAEDIINPLREFTKFSNRYKGEEERFNDEISRLWDATGQTSNYAPSPSDMGSRFKRSNLVKAKFLTDNGVKVKPFYKDATFNDRYVAEPSFQEFIKKGGGDFLKDINHKFEIDKNSPEWERFSDEWINTVKNTNYGFKKPELEEQRRNVVLDSMLELNENNNLVLMTNGNMHTDNIVASAQRVGKKMLDEQRTTNYLDKKIRDNKLDFEGYVNDLVSSYLGPAKITVKGKKQPYNLENVTESMLTSNPRGKEKSLTYTTGKARGASSVKFKNLEEAREASKKSIADDETIRQAQKLSEEPIEDLKEALEPYYKYQDTFDRLDDSMRVLSTYTKNRRSMSKERAFRDAVSKHDFQNVPSYVQDVLEKASKSFDEVPVEFFEAKPQRAVKLNEFAGAVIPSNASQKTINILEKNNIPYRKYTKQKNKGDAIRKMQKKLFSEGKEVYFTLPPALVGGSLLAEQFGEPKETNQSLLY